MHFRFSPKRLKRWRRGLNQAQIRRLCYNAYLGDHKILARVLGRYKMYLDTRDVAFAPHMLAEGYWEIWHAETMLQLVKPGMKAVDLGANMGYFSLLLSDLVGEAGSVHAFEPNPHIAAMLRDTIDINGFAGRTKVHQIALSDKSGKASFFIDPARPMNATMINREDHEIVTVPTQRFDDIDGLSNADFIKIDVEGAEQALWAGMAKRLADPRPLTIIMEFTAARYNDAAAFVDSIVDCGFALEFIDSEHGLLPTNKADILAKPAHIDQLLVLRR